MTLNDILDFGQLALGWIVLKFALEPIAWAGSSQAVLDTPISIFPRLIIIMALCYWLVWCTLAGMVYWTERTVRFVARKPKDDPSDTKTFRFIEGSIWIGSFFITAMLLDATSRFLNS